MKHTIGPSETDGSYVALLDGKKSEIQRAIEAIRVRLSTISDQIGVLTAEQATLRRDLDANCGAMQALDSLSAATQALERRAKVD